MPAPRPAVGQGQPFDGLASGGGAPAAAASFASELRRLRLRAGLTREVLSERAGLSLATLSTLEGGQRRRPYPNTVIALAEALGLAPAERTVLLELASDPATQPTERGPDPIPPPPPATTRPPVRARLPEPPTALIGRETELATASGLLDPARSAVRLLTLTGPGGVGKTRLALAVAAALADAYPDGVAWVDLAPLRDQRLVAATIARALGVRESGGRSARALLVHHLRTQRLLLVLDNFEHVLDAAPLLAELLETCPHVALLATSRAALRLRGEHQFRVAPLALAAENVPPEQSSAAPAVRLFVERAQAIVPEFTLESGSVHTVADICRRLDGLPLAIELAAARSRLLTPDALLRRLDRRLPLLTSGAADMPERQQTLSRTLAWSHDLLGTAEQVLFRRLAAFAGGWTLEAAEVVCADHALAAEDVLERLQALVDSSLVQPAADPEWEPRFGMLETVREYALGQLEASGEADAARDRHRDWCVSLAERALPELTGPDQLAWHARLDDELENFRAAREWCQRNPGGAAAGLRLAGALGRYFEVRAGREGRRWLSEALVAGPAEPSAPRARALTWSGQLESRYGEAEAGRALLEQAVAVARLVGDGPLLCLTLRHLALYIPNQAAAPALLEEAAALAHAAGDRRELALALSYLGIARRQGGDEAAAATLCAEAVTAARASGDLAALIPALFTLGSLQIARGRYDSAKALLDEALELSELLDHRGYMNTISRLLAQLALAQGDLSAARARVRASLELARPSSTGAVGLRVLQLAARLAVGSGDHHLAVRLFAAVAGWQRSHDVPPGSTLWMSWTWTPRDDDAAVTAERAARLALGEPAFAAAWAEGLRLSLDDAIDAALAAEDPRGSSGGAQIADDDAAPAQVATPEPPSVQRWSAVTD